MAASTKFSCFLFTISFVLFVLGIFSHEWVRFSKNATTVSYLPRMNQTQVMLCICQHIPGYTCYHFVWVFTLSVRFVGGFLSTLAVSGSAPGLALTLEDRTEPLLRHPHPDQAGGGGWSRVCVATDNLSRLPNGKGLCFL